MYANESIVLVNGDNQSKQGQHLLVKTHGFTEADWSAQ